MQVHLSAYLYGHQPWNSDNASLETVLIAIHLLHNITLCKSKCWVGWQVSQRTQIDRSSMHLDSAAPQKKAVYQLRYVVHVSHPGHFPLWAAQYSAAQVSESDKAVAKREKYQNHSLRGFFLHNISAFRSQFQSLTRKIFHLSVSLRIAMTRRALHQRSPRIFGRCNFPCQNCHERNKQSPQPSWPQLFPWTENISFFSSRKLITISKQGERRRTVGDLGNNLLRCHNLCHYFYCRFLSHTFHVRSTHGPR